MGVKKQRIAIAKFCGWKIGSKKFKRIDGIKTGYRWEHKTLYFGSGGGLYGFDYNPEASIESLFRITKRK